MSDIFRKSALDKISSPDQLDRAIVIVPPSFWIAAVGIEIMLCVVILWSVYGRIPVNVSANGMYMNTEGISIIYSKNAGIVDEVLVSEGDDVKKGDVLARLDRDNLDDKKEAILKRRASVEGVTLASIDDDANADSKSLLDIKAELLTLKSTLNSNEEMLAMRQKDLYEKRADADAAQEKMQQARNMYYGFMVTKSTTPEQLEYQTAQSDLGSTKSYYENAKSAYDSFKAENSDNIDYLEGELIRLEEKKQSLDPEAADYASQLDSLQEQIYEVENKRDTLLEEKDNYKDAYDEWKGRLSDAQSRYYSTAYAYIDAEKAELATKTFDTQLADAYNMTLNDYNTALSALRSVEDAVSQLTVQVSSEEANVADRYASLEAQFDSTKGSIIAGIDKELEDLEDQISKFELTASIDGYVVEVDIAAGNAVQQGAPLMQIAPDVEETDDMGVVLYVPWESAKKVQEGMRVMVYPSTANKQEYGHINATVSHVDYSPATSEEMKNKLGDDSLVQSFTKSGPVEEVMVELKLNPATKSGYDWSSRKGAGLELLPETLVSADIVTDEKAPISMLLPYIKEKLTLKDEHDTGDKN